MTRELTPSELDWLCEWVSDDGDSGFTSDYTKASSVIDWLEPKLGRVYIPEAEFQEAQYLVCLARREGEGAL
jgi:hypothetical protein